MSVARAEHGAVPPDVQRQIVERSEGTLTTFDIPDAGHHMMFDVPRALVTAVLATLHGWGFAPAVPAD